MNDCIQLLRTFTGHKHIKILPRCNSALYIALSIAKKLGKTTLLIQDQGYWLSYMPIAELLRLRIIKIKTDNAVMMPDELKKHKDSILLYTQPAAYFAEQPLKEINDICKENNILNIADCSGSLGSEHINKEADIIVASFSEWKPLNLGYGGMISCKENHFPLVKAELSLFETYPICDKLTELLNKVDSRYLLFENSVKKIKKDLSHLNIIHKDKWGIDVIIAYKDETEKKEIEDYCKKENLEFTHCPREIRILKNAISIETKRLE